MGMIGALSRARSPPRIILPSEMKAVRELAKNVDLLILLADKGQSTVVMEPTDCSIKVQALLGGHDTYQLMAKDPTGALERKINSVLWSLRQKRLLSDGAYHHLCSSAGGVPCLYGLPKSINQIIPSRLLCPLCHHRPMNIPSS